MNILLAPSTKENEENNPPSSSYQRDNGRHRQTTAKTFPKSVLLGSSRRFPHANSQAGQRDGYTPWNDSGMSPTSFARDMDETLAEQGWSNNGNGVYIHHDHQRRQGGATTTHNHARGAYIHNHGTAIKKRTTATTLSSSDGGSFSNGTQRTGLQRRFNANNSSGDVNHGNNNGGSNGGGFRDDHLDTTPTERNACRSILRSTTAGMPKNDSPQSKRKMIVMSFAVGLALIGYFAEIRQIMSHTYTHSFNTATDGFGNNGDGRTATSKKDWLTSLPRSFSSSILGGTGGGGGDSLGGKFGFDSDGHRDAELFHRAAPTLTMESMEGERRRVNSLYKSRADRRRMRTMPPSTYPTNPAAAPVVADAVAAAAAGGASKGGETGGNGGTPTPKSDAPPRLTLDLPAHRELVNNEQVHRSLQEVGDNDEHNEAHLPPPSSTSSSNGQNSNVRRRDLRNNANNNDPATPICGPHATEASQLNPQHYPPVAHIGPKSRIVITGALSQIGMELVLQLYEECHVGFIAGIDSSYPNTRHERLDMIENRYKYIERRFPGFQRLSVPMFGIHPHPKMGEEVRFEAMGQGYDLVNRLRPTHIVHLAGLEEGRGEHVDYGDTVDASPFATPGGKSAMMRRFESLLSMDQVFSSVGNQKEVQPQIVYVSSIEAGDQSGVTLKSGEAVGGSGANGNNPASVYGTTSLLKEVLASYYHTHHGVDSVGLRVPAMFGPYSRPGSLMHDLAERTIRNAAGHDVEGVPKYHHERDRYSLSSIFARREGADSGDREQMIHVFDVASAIVAAMQFKKDYRSPTIDPNGPTLLNLGSKLTASMSELTDRMEGYLPPHDTANDSPSQVEIPGSSNAVVANDRGLSIYDTERNRDLLGWTPKTPLHEGTKDMLAWHIFNSYPFGLPPSVPAQSTFQTILDDSSSTLSFHILPCASGCRWGGKMCVSSPWDHVIETTKYLTKYCPYVIYTVDLRPELVQLEKNSAPSQRKGWEDYFCKIAFVSSSSELAQATYGYGINLDTFMDERNGSLKARNWIVVAVPGTFNSMPEDERLLPKLSPTNLFHDNVEKAMYVNHRRVILTTDQAMGVMQHMEMNARTAPEKKTIQDEKTKEDVDIWLPPHPYRHSVFFTNKFSFEEGFDTSSAKNLAKFVMANAGIAETRSIREQMQFYEQSGHLTRMNIQRSPNYQEFFQDNFFPYDFIRTSWLVHELKSEEGRTFRCEMYEEHSLWGNNEMEDMSMAFVLAKRKVKMQMGKMVDHQYAGREEWYAFLEPKEADDEDGITDGPVYLDYLEAAHKVTTDSKGHEFYVTFLPQNRKE
eukprot:CAMPEP_0181134492 /NCGR_PEP_ID=MMETSP1071-20121207/32117_1 /TAXON_ID=35127 /ORGANISM="Thalassiosira sp., Strain NH16" /LENGTH=1311 /DNA_ID=CAMNT_0023221015 /DNA_START=260 /DNA_END=4195 /DNA_ORIENTATION=+